MNYNDEQPVAVDLVALHEAIKTGLRGAFPVQALKVVDYYARPGEAVESPSVYFELDSTPAEDPSDVGTEQWATNLEFAAWVTVSHKGQGSAQLAVRVLALAIAAAIRGQKWGCPVGPALLTGCEPGEFIADPNKGYFVWRVSWTHTALVGPSTFAMAGMIPTGVYLGVDPLIGPNHVPDYQIIFEGSPMQSDDIPDFVERSFINTIRGARVGMKIDNVVTPEGEFASSILGWAVVFTLYAGPSSASAVLVSKTSASGAVTVSPQSAAWAIEGADTATAPTGVPLYFTTRVTDTLGRGWVVAYGTFQFTA